FCRFFFFQAEDGIRDFHVTGVQTCALPIYPPHLPFDAQHLSQQSLGTQARLDLRYQIQVGRLGHPTPRLRLVEAAGPPEGGGRELVDPGQGRLQEPLPIPQVGPQAQEGPADSGGPRRLLHRFSPPWAAAAATGSARTNASTTRRARSMASTSWTRTRSAPCTTAVTTAARVPSRRSWGGVPRTSPRKDLREGPTRRGRPQWRNRPSWPSRTRLSWVRLPKPRPGSRMSCSRATPASVRAWIRSRKN